MTTKTNAATRTRAPATRGHKILASLRVLDEDQGTTLALDRIRSALAQATDALSLAVALDVTPDEAHRIRRECRALGWTQVEFPALAETPRGRRPGSQSAPGADGPISVAVAFSDGSERSISAYGVSHCWVFRGPTPDTLTDDDVHRRCLPSGSCKSDDIVYQARVAGALSYYLRDKATKIWSRVQSVDGSTAEYLRGHTTDYPDPAHVAIPETAPEPKPRKNKH